MKSLEPAASPGCTHSERGAAPSFWWVGKALLGPGMVIYNRCWRCQYAIWELIQVPDAPLLIQFPVNVTGKTSEDDPSA